MTTANQERLQDRVRHARLQYGMSQRAIAAVLGVGRSAVAQWEQANGTRPGLGNLAALSIATGVSLDWLANGRGRMHADAVAAPNSSADHPACAQEFELIRCYRRLSSRRRVMAVRLLEQLAAAV